MRNATASINDNAMTKKQGICREVPEGWVQHHVAAAAHFPGNGEQSRETGSLTEVQARTKSRSLVAYRRGGSD